MIRGTTPTCPFELPFNVSMIDKLWITFAQNGLEAFTLTEKECVMEGVMITITLSQEQTLKLDANSVVEVQFRVLMYNGTAIASDLINIPIHRILKEGVLK